MTHFPAYGLGSTPTSLWSASDVGTAIVTPSAVQRSHCVTTPRRGSLSELICVPQTARLFYLRARVLATFHTANKAEQKRWPRWSRTFSLGGKSDCFDPFRAQWQRKRFSSMSETIRVFTLSQTAFWCLRDQTSYCYSNELGNISVLLASWPSRSQSELQQPRKQLLLSAHYTEDNINTASSQTLS